MKIIISITFRIVAMTALLIALNPHLEPAILMLEGLLVFVAWASTLEPVLKSHHRHKDTNWILEKRWFQNLIYRECWLPKRITLFWKIAMILLITLPSVVTIVALNFVTAFDFATLRYLLWFVLVCIFVQLASVIFIESFLQLVLGNIVVGLGIVLVSFAGFYSWKILLLKKIILMILALFAFVLNLFLVDLIRAWRRQHEAAN